jgi:DNA-binding MarR family transcriptional regulator
MSNPVELHETRTPESASPDTLSSYIDTLSYIERLHRLILDVIKDEFERLNIMDVNSVQALLLYNIGDNEVTAGELKSRGYYQGSNVSYNLKKLVEAGYISHERCSIDRRAVRISLTEKGRDMRVTVSELWVRHIDKINEDQLLHSGDFDSLGDLLKRLERFWSDQIRYIY